MGGKSHAKGHKRGGGRGRGPRPRPGAAPPTPPPDPTGDALVISLTGSPASLAAAAAGDAFPASVVPEKSSAAAAAGSLRLGLDSWAAMEPAMAWLRGATAADTELSMAFSPALGKEHRAAVHAAAKTVGLGALAAVSSGVGDVRRVTVARTTSEAVQEARAERAGTAADPAAAAKAALLYEWARREGAVLSRDEALEIFAAGGTEPEKSMPEALAAVWAARWPRQEAAAALCAAAGGGDAAALAAAIASAPDVVKSGACDELSGAAPLHAAAAAGDAAAAEALLAAGAPLDGLDGDGATALSVARRCEACDVEGALLQAGAADPDAPAAAADVAAWGAARAFPSVAVNDAGPAPPAPHGGAVADSAVSVCGTDNAVDRLAELGSMGSGAVPDFIDADYVGSAAGSVVAGLPSPQGSLDGKDREAPAGGPAAQEEHPGTPDNEAEGGCSGGGAPGGGRLRRRLRGLAPPLAGAVVAGVSSALEGGRAALGSGLAALEGSRAFRASSDFGQRALESGKAALSSWSNLAAAEGFKVCPTGGGVGRMVLEGGKAAVEGGRGAVAAAAGSGRRALSAAEDLAAAGRRAAAGAAEAADQRAREGAAWARAHGTALAVGAAVAVAAAAAALLLRDRAANTRHRARYTL